MHHQEHHEDDGAREYNRVKLLPLLAFLVTLTFAGKITLLVAVIAADVGGGLRMLLCHVIGTFIG